MKRVLTLMFLLYFISRIAGNAQPPAVFNANDIEISKTFSNYLFAQGFISSNYFSFPKGSSTSTLYFATLNVTGKDSATSNIHAFNSFSVDVPTIDGPLSVDGNLDTTNHEEYRHIWNITEADINEFLQAYYQGGTTWANYQIKPDILTWPANGPSGFDNTLSDYYDMNNDGLYNPLDGDYPLIKGSQMLRWIYNDMGNYQNNGMGLEIRASLFGCSSYPITSPINRTVFVEYEIFNRSLRTYQDLQCGLFLDFDIGCSTDDYFRTQVESNGVQAYNSTEDDVCNGPNSFTNNTPVQSVSILSVNNQSTGNLLYSSALVENGIQSVSSQPNNTVELYNIFRGNWASGSPKYFGGLGVDSTLGFGSTRFMYQGDSDPSFLGMEIPNYPFYWTMENIDGVGNQAPAQDVRATLASIPQTFRPNEKITILFAFITTQDPNLSIPQLLEKNKQEMLDVKERYINNQFNCLSYSTSIPQVSSFKLSLYPNPASNEIFLEGLSESDSYKLKVYDINGKVWLDENWSNGKSLNLSRIKSGIYVLQLQNDNGEIWTEKFIKIE